MKLRRECTALCVKSSASEKSARSSDTIADAVRAITDLLTTQGLICLDLADVRTVLAGGGRAVFAKAEASGPDRARLAADDVIRQIRAATRSDAASL